MAILGNFLGGWCHSSIDLVLNWLVKIMLKRTNVQLDAQTDGKWRLSTRPLVVVNMALTTVMNATAKFSNDGKDTEVNS